MAESGGVKIDAEHVALTLANGAVTIAIPWAVDFFAPISGFQALFLIFALIAVGYGVALAKKQRTLRAAREILVLLASAGAAFWYLYLISRAGLTTMQVAEGFATYLIAVGGVAYLLTLLERTVWRRLRAKTVRRRD